MDTTQKPNAEGLLGVRGVTVSTTPENPPAFPAAYAGHLAGMTLRDWFAGQALAECISVGRAGADPKHDPREFYPTIAAMAYKFADAMLAERVK